MKIWSSNDLEKALNIKTNVSGNIIHFNSTDLHPGDIFLALGNGHNYIKDAISRGASAIIAEEYIDGIDKESFIIVPNCLDALDKMAHYKRIKSNAQFIGVTGSAGKTSTKDIIYNILKNFGNSFVSRGNFNNHLGVRLNLASIPNNLEYAIFEIGMNNKGEIAPLADLVKPDIAIITNILDAHLGHFNSTLDIAKEKSDIFSAMDNNGIGILNIDNKHFDDCKKYAQISKIYSFGTSKNADSVLTHYESSGYEAKLNFSVLGEDITLNTQITGEHNALNIASILLLVKILNLDIKQICNYFSSISLLKGRGEKTKITLNGHESIIINDCYNASPSSMKYSLITLKEIKHSYKIAILADMKELGKKEVDYHKELAPFIIDAGIKCLYTVGPLMKNLHDTLKNKIEIRHFESSIELKKHILELVTRPSIILLKGSKSMNLMDIADFLTIENNITEHAL